MVKRILIFGAFIIGGICSMNAQNISKHAIGLRLGDNDGLGAEVSYQLGLNEVNRLELDLGWRESNNVDVIKLAGIYQWVWNIDQGFNWYAGPGGGLVFVSYNGPDGEDYNDTHLFIAGDIGLEYNFNFPLLLSLDFRPEIGFGENDDDLNFDIALGIRYQF